MGGNWKGVVVVVAAVAVDMAMLMFKEAFKNPDLPSKNLRAPGRLPFLF